MSGRLGLTTLLGIALATHAHGSMDSDAEAQAVLRAFQAMPSTQTYLDDPLEGSTKGKVTGPVSFGPGVTAAGTEGGKAAQFPDQRVEELYVYYGPYVPVRGKFTLDFRLDALPKEHTFMTLFSVGTAGNTCLTARLYLDLTVKVTVWTARERVTTFSDPVALGEWHHLEFWYGPEGSVLRVDGALEDFATDWSVPYAHNRSNAFYLGDQPWWDANGRKGLFYPLDSFVGRLDNLRLERLEPEAEK